MSETIGTGVIKVTGDASEFKATVADAKKDARSLGDELGNSTQAGAQRAQRGVEAYITKLQQAAQNVGKTSSELKLMELAQRGATEAQLAEAAAALKVIDAHRVQQAELRRTAAAAAAAAAADQRRAASTAALGAQTKLTAFQAQQLSFQLQDFFVQVQAGQSPITALIQQGSQLSGTFNGFGGALNAVLSIFTPVRVAVGGLAAVIATMSYAAYQGSEESRQLQRSLSLTGNAAGITQGQFDRLAVSIAGATKTTAGSARDTLQQLVASGRLSGEALSATATSVQLVAKATGQATDEVLKDFLNLADNVSKGAEELNKRYNFLTAEQLRYIRTLEDQGDRQKAVAVTMQALNGHVDTAAKNVGFLQGAWDRAKQAVSGYLDAAKSIGRAPTVDDELERAEKRAARFAGILNGTGIPALGEFKTMAGFKEALDKEEALIARLKESKALGEQVAAAQADQASRNQAAIAWDKLKEQTLTKQARLAKELADANALADKNNISAAEREIVLAQIREKYEDKGAISKVTEARKATLSSALADIESSLKGQVNAYQNSEAILEATRSAGLTGEKAYYEAKQAFVRLNADAEIASLQKQNERLAKEKATGADRIAIQKEIAKNEAEIERIRVDAATKGIVLTTQQAAALAAQARAYNDAKVAAEQYLQMLSLQGEREVAAIGMSDKARERAAGRQQINDRYTQQRQELEATRAGLELEGKFTEEARDQYQKRQALIDEYNGKALESYERTYDKRAALESNAAVGADRALQNYRDSAADIAKQTEDLYSRAFESLEDGLTEFVMTGKLNFRSLADSIIADIVRIQIRAALSKVFEGSSGAGGLLGMIAGLFGGSSGLGAATAVDVGAAGGGLMFLSGGGYTGDGGKNEPAGIVHRGEYVINAERTRALGTAFLNQLNGYAAGGLVGGPSAGAGARGPLTLQVNIDGTVEKGLIRQYVSAGVQEGLRQYDAQLSAQGVK